MRLRVHVCVCLVRTAFLPPPLPHHYGFGASTKSAVIRIGLLEMWRFVSLYYQGCQHTTLLESCGVADLIATCLGGRNRRVAEAFVLTGKVREGGEGGREGREEGGVADPITTCLGGRNRRVAEAFVLTGKMREGGKEGGEGGRKGGEGGRGGKGGEGGRGVWLISLPCASEEGIGVLSRPLCLWER